MFRSTLLCLLLVVWLQYSTSAQPFRFGKRLPSPYLNLKPSDARLLADDSGCRVLLVESIPRNLTYPLEAAKHASTVFAWSALLDLVENNLSIASFYWTLLAEPQFNKSAVNEGRMIFDALMKKSRTTNVTIAQSGPPSNDPELGNLTAAGAKVFWVDVSKLLGRGILHTKLWITDRKHAYLGSANMDWRSLTEVKELGALMLGCPALVKDLDKIHTAYCKVADGIPSEWPLETHTQYNRTNPMKVNINGVPSRVYFSSSPRQFNPPGRTYDLDAILSTIAKAKEYVYISVMDYSPEIVDYRHPDAGEYWPVIDDALRQAAVDRKVEVRMLISRWPYTSPSMMKYLTSLRTLNGVRGSRIRVRYFIVPAVGDQKIIPHARVNHNKYMVTDQTAYIGTSNWSGDYFKYTGGAALVLEDDRRDSPFNDYLHYADDEPKTIRKQLRDIFYRDWNSEYSIED